MPIINKELCEEKWGCVDVCENDVFQVVNGRSTIVGNNCLFCMECLDQCETGAITFPEE